MILLDSVGLPGKAGPRGILSWDTGCSRGPGWKPVLAWFVRGKFTKGFGPHLRWDTWTSTSPSGNIFNDLLHRVLAKRITSLRSMALIPVVPSGTQKLRAGSHPSPMPAALHLHDHPLPSQPAAPTVPDFPTIPRSKARALIHFPN